MATNAALAEILLEIADPLDLGGEKFKPEAYRRAARSLQSLAEDVRAVADRGELATIPGVGDAISEKIREYLRDGRIEYYDRLRQQYPAGLLELMRLPGLGPKTARRFWLEVGVEGPQELKDAIAAGKLNGLKGFGPRKIELVRAALSAPAGSGRRATLVEAYDLAERIVAHLRATTPMESVAVAGSLRRRRETIGDIDILVTSRDPERVFDAFTAFPERRATRLRGSTKETIEVVSGVQVDLRVVAPEAFGAALQYFTGSKDHNVRLRTIARDHELKVNEYGVFRGEELIAGATEEDVYAALGLAFVPPEIRENQGEVELASLGRVPRLVEAPDLVGDLHVHLAAGAPTQEQNALVDRALERGLRHLGIVVDGVDGAKAGPIDALRARAAGRLMVLRAVEVEGWAAGSSGSAPPHDYRILRPGTESSPPSKTEKPPPGGFAVVAHLGTPDAPPDPVAAGTWARWALEGHAAMDIGPGWPEASIVRRHVEAGGLVHIPSSPPTDGGDRSLLALGTARRGWTTRERVINASAAPPLGGAASRPAKSR